MEKLSSLDVARYIRHYTMERYRVALNKTQVNKLLYICFAYYLVMSESTNSPFSDEECPRAWPFGPVFPRVYKWFDENDFSVENWVVEDVQEDRLWSIIIPFVVEKYHGYSASELTHWTHRAGSPWHETVYGKDGMKAAKWNLPIDNRLIYNYFKPRK